MSTKTVQGAGARTAPAPSILRAISATLEAFDMWLGDHCDRVRFTRRPSDPWRAVHAGDPLDYMMVPFGYPYEDRFLHAARIEGWVVVRREHGTPACLIAPEVEQRVFAVVQGLTELWYHTLNWLIDRHVLVLEEGGYFHEARWWWQR